MALSTAPIRLRSACRDGRHYWATRRGRRELDTPQKKIVCCAGQAAELARADCSLGGDWHTEIGMNLLGLPVEVGTIYDTWPASNGGDKRSKIRASQCRASKPQGGVPHECIIILLSHYHQYIPAVWRIVQRCDSTLATCITCICMQRAVRRSCYQTKNFRFLVKEVLSFFSPRTMVIAVQDVWSPL